MANAHASTSQLVAKIPLIKSPELWIPKPVALPSDIHPLPTDINAYFVYPYAVEAHALSVLPGALEALRARQEERRALLAARLEASESERQAVLRRIAPGWSQGTVMEPLRRKEAAGAAQVGEQPGEQPVDELMALLSSLDTARSV